jgi:DNA (cytosine-5)-methyltransferase 1
MRQAAIPIVSLFCGAGGLDLGFRDEGFTAVLALDSNQATVETYNANDAAARAVQCDIRRLAGEELLALLRTRAPGVRPRGLIGGPPCQSFSIGNVRKRRSDRRGALGIHYARLLEVLNRAFDLDFFVFENVTGLKNPKHRRQYRRILSALGKAGFNVFTGQLDASAFGVPQRRHRLLLVGINRRRFPWVQYEFPCGGAQRPLTVRDVIANLPEPVFFERGLKAEAIPFHPNHWAMNPRSPKFASGETVSNGDGRSFLRLEWDRPSRTVAYGNREVHVHPGGHRRLSVLEAMLLQGFPSDYKFRGTLSDQISQVSNAVPPPLARALAHSVKTQLYGRMESLQQALLAWFDTHQRHFPWRETSDPFRLLVTEKLLQQTAAAPPVVEAYRKLFKKFPDCDSLAQATTTQVTRIIEPLGLHYRAGELVKLAKAIRDQHEGKVPSSLRELLALPGVGDYCARAILAFAYQEQVPIVDTNVARFLMRFFRLRGPKTANPARNRALLEIAGGLVPASHPREFNLAILDLCNAHCFAGEPLCKSCPLRHQCGYAQTLPKTFSSAEARKVKNALSKARVA